MSRTRRRVERGQRPAAFRAAPSAVPAARPSRGQALALLAALAVVAGSVTLVSFVVRPDRARSFALFHGSVLLADSVAPVAVDLASGRPTVRLINADQQVGARTSSDLAVTPLDQGTLLLNRRTGEFNLVAATGFVVKTDGGVPIAPRAGATGATAISSGDLAYIEQTGPTGTSVYLVGQSTVETASNVAAQVRPRAFRSMSEPGSTAPGAAASADGSLWLLLGTGDQHVVRQLDVPPNSSTGATLHSTDHGVIDGPAALASATTTTQTAQTASTTRGSAGAATGDVVGVASASSIRVFSGSTELGAGRFPAIPGLDRVLAATSGQGRLSYLFHGSAGWSAASIGADGRGLRGPTPLTGVSDDAALTAPAESGGSLYTMDTASGRLIRIDADGRVGTVPGAASYPLAEQDGRVVEPGGFSDGYVLARASRVVYNSPTHLNALVVFTDASHRPMTVEKSSAVAVSASSGAEALTRSRLDAGAQRTTRNPSTTPKAGTAVNNKIDCKTVRQKPHIPTIVAATPGSRSVALSWSYPLLSPQDCAPSTYQVNVKLLSSDAPSPPATVVVQGQQSVNLAGLFPSTQYEITVGAYINGAGTDSPPRRITTGPEGPAAPKKITATPDSSGNWNVTWTSCGSVRSGCVAAASWKVIPEFCDGRGLSGAPAPISVTADPTTATQPPAQLRGGDALLGRGLRFQVEGIGTQGAVGEPSGYTACTYSWSPPVVAALQLSASQPANTQLGGTTSTTVNLDLGKNALHDVGGVGAQVTFTLDGPGATRTRGPITVTGDTGTISATFTGVQAGAVYTASARISPPRRPEAAVSVAPVAVTTRADWPALTVDASCASPTLLVCPLGIRIGGISSAAAGGETFDLAAGSQVRCANTVDDLTPRTGFDPAQTTITAQLSQLGHYFGTCQVTIALVEDAAGSGPKVFGGTTSPATTVSVDLGPPAAADVQAGELSPTWSGGFVQLAYTGSKDLSQLTQNWGETILAPNGTSCGSASSQPDLDVAVDPSCVNRFGDQADGWSVSVSYQDRTDGDQHTVVAALGGAPPGYQPCTPGALTASWDPTRAQGVNVATSAAPASLAGCSSWTYTIQDADGSQVCQTSTDATPSAPTTDISLASCGTPPADGWTLSVSWNDTAGNGQDQGPLPITGDPPQT